MELHAIDDVVVETSRVESEADGSLKPEAKVVQQASLTPVGHEDEQHDFPVADEEQVYAALVVDSGPIIRLTGLTTLRGRAKRYYTVPGVLQEIRDAKARDHFDQLPFQLILRDASAEGIHAVTQFARQTGDYNSLSAVDLQVLGLVYDLEREGCEGNMDHIRKTPKRKIGLGKVEFLSGKRSLGKEKAVDSSEMTTTPTAQIDELQETLVEPELANQKPAVIRAPNAPKTYAMIANLAKACTTLPIVDIAAEESEAPEAAEESEAAGSDEHKIHDVTAQLDAVDLVGQFSDAEESDDDDFSDEKSSDGDEGYDDPDKDISDEDCDVYVLDPEEVEERNRNLNGGDVLLQQELMSEFPSFAASLHVPYEGEDLDGEPDEHDVKGPLTEEELEERKMQSLKPISESGKLYNSFPKYKNLLKPKENPSRQMKFTSDEPTEDDIGAEATHTKDNAEATQDETIRSRIIGGAGMSGQELEVEDDGEGWITCSQDIHKAKASGGVFLARNSAGPNNASSQAVGPPVCNRAACATTDFAMQNVILQMNLELLSVDGVKIRRLKSWVLRCGACFTVHADGAGVGPLGTKRMFCSRCGSDMMQRIAASVDGKSGRLRLHLSQRHKNSLRGTKFSLPKPGTGNRFQGDLLLREDQLLTGAWNQKVKMMTGGKSRHAAQSMFGSDLASTVGCNASAVKNDIKVGFGRRNPNAAKGRERRGKKEKSSDKACGLRRY